MRIISLNVWQGRLEKVLLKHLATLDIDFACIQEAVDYREQSGGLVTSYQAIAESARLDHTFFSPLIGSRLGSSELIYGNAMFSNIPFSQTSTVFTKGEFKDNFSFDSDDYNIRAFQHSVIDINGKLLNIINHHGHHIESHKLGDDETTRQVEQILDYIKDLEGAVILCGDFNLAPGSESIKKIDNKLKNLPAEYSLKTTRSKLTYKDEVCDYIFINDMVKINDFIMDTTIVSDHNALILDFDI